MTVKQRRFQIGKSIFAFLVGNGLYVPLINLIFIQSAFYEYFLCENVHILLNVNQNENTFRNRKMIRNRTTKMEITKPIAIIR